MSKISEIRKLYFDKGLNISQINAETGLDRKTIRKFIEKSDWNKELKRIIKKSDFPKLDKYKSIIDSWLNEDKKARKKQRHTARRVYDRLIEQYQDQFNCSYRTVAGYVSVKKKEIFGKKSGYLPLEHIAGEAQADFGEADYYENGRFYNGHFLNLSFPNSNNGCVQLLKGENQECLFEGLINIFNHIGGVPTVIWFDNASSIVKKISKNGKRDLTDAFIRFMEHYGFKAQFCNANAGHEKGNVEAKVGYHRRNMLVPVPHFNNLADFNKELLDLCRKDACRDHYRKNATIEELFKEDQAELLKIPDISLDVSKYITVKTNDYGRFYLNNGIHEYSVSPKYSKSKILVKLTANEVIPLDESYREIVRHDRFYGNQKQQSMKWIPYLQQLSRCPGALKYSGIYSMLPDPMQDYLDKCDKSSRGMVLKMVHELTKISGFDKAVDTINKALEYEVIDNDSLLSLHKRLHDPNIELPPIHSDNIPYLQPIHFDLTSYDENLLNKGAL